MAKVGIYRCHLVLAMRFAAVLPLIALSACQIPPDQREAAHFYQVPSGSTLILNRRIVIPPYELKIYIQNGRLARGANQVYPFCKFEVRNKKDHPQIVEPGEFRIYRVDPVRSLFVTADSPYLLAGALLSGTIFEHEGKPTPEVYGSRMFLRSDQQPEVYQLVCGHLQDPNIEARYLSINQIRETLGDTFTLKLAP